MMNHTDTAREKLIVALDFSEAESALALDQRLGDVVRWVKVGLELFSAAGPRVVRALRDRDRQVFLDLKLHDIPNTVVGAVRAAADHGAGLLTLHAEGGPAMMEAACQARDASGSGLRLLAVTVLTSLDGTEYPTVYRSGEVKNRVAAFARAAHEAGVDGVVCSPLELESLAGVVPDEFLKVTPGIRPGGTPTEDQSRVATPAAAMKAGASHLVIGRPITRAHDPSQAVRDILESLTDL